MMRRALGLMIATMSLWGLACGDDAEGSGGAGGSGAAGGTGGTTTTETCEATYAILQKDAYKETAGRSTALWPPHTTTTLSVVCTPQGGDLAELVGDAVQANHGTMPGEVDANGDVFLEEVAATTVTGTRDELLELLSAYEACSCEAATEFLSLDALQDQAVQDLLETLAGYLSTNLTCNGMTDTAGLIMLLEQGMIEQALAVLPECTWAGGTDLEQGLNEALEQLIAAAGETLDGYHVCNNDARLQTGLIDAYVAGGTVVPCDAATDTCRGPSWFYDP